MNSEIIINIVVLGWIWNFIIFLKHSADIGRYMSYKDDARLDNLPMNKIINKLYTKGYIPYYTLFKYKSFRKRLFEYQEDFPNADSIDYLYYIITKKD